MRKRDFDDDELDYEVSQRTTTAAHKVERPYSSRFVRRTPKTAAHPCGINGRGYKRRTG
jgi:hypothetical protein